MQDESTENLVATKTNNDFKLIKRKIIFGVSAVAVALVLVLMLPGKSKTTEGQTASVVAVNQAENANPSQADGYTITNGTGATMQNTSPAPQSPSSVSTQQGLQPSSAALGMGDQLSQISTQLQAIQDDLGTGSANNIEAIKTQLNSIISQMQDLVAQSTNNISQQINTFSSSVGSELGGMKDQLKVIQQLSQPGNYIDPSNLPFKVQFIDSVGGQPVVTVSYNKLLTPISVGESLAGWGLISADYASQYAVFQNSKAQLVKAVNNEITEGAQ